MSDDVDIPALIEHQMDTQGGVASFTVKDGTVFVFDLAVLERLVDKARSAGRVMVFVKKGLTS